ncbi:MAG TPA: hypothetical protein VK793_12890 [Steroidobacteraceae bacterium]|jgi:hypothetical protein|nr:hypothetical protein [Steroidobacteraceae bacterium]
MRYLVLLAVVLCVAVVLVLVFLKLLRDLLVRDFFDAPSLPDAHTDPASAREALQQEAKSPTAQPY